MDDEKKIILNLIKTIESLEVEKEDDWSISKIEFMRKYGHM